MRGVSYSLFGLAGSLLVACTAAEQTQNEAPRHVTLEIALASLPNDSISHFRRWQAADRDCHNAYPDELKCALKLADWGASAVESSWQRAESKAREVDAYGIRSCSPEERKSGMGCSGEGDNSLGRGLEDSRRHWKEYAEAQCGSEALKARGGWGANADWAFCSARLSALRADELNAMMHFYEEEFAPETLK